MHDWLDIIVPGVQIALIVLAALLLQHPVRRIIRRASDHYQFPHEPTPSTAWCAGSSWAALELLALERLGFRQRCCGRPSPVSAAVGAVAFFAAWSVLSNLFCAFLIFTVWGRFAGRPYRAAGHG